MQDIYLEENEYYIFELVDVYGDGLSASMWNGTDGNWTLEDRNVISQGQEILDLVHQLAFYVKSSTPSFMLEDISSRWNRYVFQIHFPNLQQLKFLMVKLYQLNC